MFNQVTQRMKGKKPQWMTEEIHKEMMAIPDVNETFKKRSEQNKKNRRGGSLSNEVEPSHFQGSISTSQHAKKMAKLKGGVLPNTGELFLKTHFKEVPGKGKVAASKQAKEIAETFQKKLDETSAQGVPCNPNQLYWETVGGRKKGFVKGLGQSEHLYYSTPRPCDASQTCTPSIESLLLMRFEERMQAVQSKLEAQLETRVQSQFEALATNLATMEKRNQAFLEELRKSMSETWHNFNSCTPIATLRHPQHNGPEGDDDGSSSGAGCI